MKCLSNRIDGDLTIDDRRNLKRKIKNFIKEINYDLKEEFEKLGRHTFDWLSKNPETSLSYNTEAIKTNLEHIEKNSSMILEIEDSLIEDLISYEDHKYHDGLEKAKTKLQEQLCYGEIGIVDFDYELYFTERWFANYEQIRSIRSQRRDKQISWDKMEQHINKLLEINI